MAANGTAHGRGPITAGPTSTAWRPFLLIRPLPFILRDGRWQSLSGLESGQPYSPYQRDLDQWEQPAVMDLNGYDNLGSRGDFNLGGHAVSDKNHAPLAQAKFR